MAGMTSHFFNARMTAAQMKSAYKKLALTWHPDINKSADALEQMKKINVEFSYWYSRAASEQVYQEKTQKAAEEKRSTDYSKYRSQEYIDSLEAMINWYFENGLDYTSGIEAEIIGVFIWIGGIRPEDVEIRNLIKSVGFQGGWKYHDDGSREYMWKWTPEIKRFASNPNIDDIRRNYGSDRIQKKTVARKQLKG